MIDKGIRRHIIVWGVASLVGYLSCVGLFVARFYMPHELLTKPFFFLTEKVIASVMGISFLTGVLIYAEVVSGIPFLKRIQDDALSTAIFSVGLLYCVSWIWTYS